MNAKLMTALLSTAFFVGPNGTGWSQTASPTPAVRNAPRAGGWPTPGTNSFTEGQVQARLAAHGFENITGLQKDSTGIWRGFATKQDTRQPVAVDFRGDVFSGPSATVVVTTSSNGSRPQAFGPNLSTSEAGKNTEIPATSGQTAPAAIEKPPVAEPR
ncbi:MAG: hypothetical protein EOP02_00035 [Proteobacteria bacterium]|nr:MAG: hypothetical protein EOP02_00035 [Pseudomonadota bacterium]